MIGLQVHKAPPIRAGIGCRPARRGVVLAVCRGREAIVGGGLCSLGGGPGPRDTTVLFTVHGKHGLLLVFLKK